MSCDRQGVGSSPAGATTIIGEWSIRHWESFRWLAVTYETTAELRDGTLWVEKCVEGYGPVLVRIPLAVIDELRKQAKP